MYHHRVHLVTHVDDCVQLKLDDFNETAPWKWTCRECKYPNDFICEIDNNETYNSFLDKNGTLA